MIDPEKTHLTEKQLEVLRKKKKGKSLKEIAKSLSTTRSNISHILKTARKNIENAENTLKLIETMEWPLRINFQAGANLYEISKQIFNKANENNIRLNFTGSELVDYLGSKVGGKTVDRKIQKEINVAISEKGGVEILVS